MHIRGDVGATPNSWITEIKYDGGAEAITNLIFTVIGEAEFHHSVHHPRKLTKFTTEASCLYAELLS